MQDTTLDIQRDGEGRIVSARPMSQTIAVPSLSRPGHTYLMRWVDCEGWMHSPGDHCLASQTGRYCRHRRIAQQEWLAAAPPVSIAHLFTPLDLDREFAAIEMEAVYAESRGND